VQKKKEIGIRKDDESKGSVKYTKLDAFVQLRLDRSQGTEAIRKSTLPFSLYRGGLRPLEGCKVERLKCYFPDAAALQSSIKIL
jgi:hypothetical protein